MENQKRVHGGNSILHLSPIICKRRLNKVIIGLIKSGIYIRLEMYAESCNHIYKNPSKSERRGDEKQSSLVWSCLALLVNSRVRHLYVIDC